METIDMKIYEPVPGKKGLVREIGFRKAKDVFHELEERLRQLGLYPDEYFVLNSPYDDKGALFPEIVTMNCYANWGGSEGIYLEVDLIAVEDGKLVRRNFATGKSLAEDGESFDRLLDSEHISVIRQRNALHSVSQRFIHKTLDTRLTIKNRVLRMDVKMYEINHRYRSFNYSVQIYLY